MPDASSSADFVQKATSFIPTIVIATASYIGGIVSRFGKTFIDDHFAEKRRVKKHKLEVARHVLTICTEASSHMLNVAPRDYEDVTKLKFDLYAFDPKLAKTLEDMVENWIQHAETKEIIKDLIASGDRPDKEDIKTVKMMRDRAVAKRDVLIAWASEVRTGIKQKNKYE